MMEKGIATKAISKTRVLWQHPYSTWDIDKVSIMTKEIDGHSINDFELKKDIAKELDIIVRKVHDHFYHKSLLMDQATVKAEKTLKSSQQSSIDTSGRELEELGLDSELLSFEKPKAMVEKELVSVTPNMVELIEITQDSKVIVSIFPLSFGCRYCGHFAIIDPDKDMKLECPCCKEKGNQYCKNCGGIVKSESGKCTKGHDTIPIQLHQESIVNVCPRCANTFELSPIKFKHSDVNGNGVFECPECKSAENRKRIGHLHLNLGQNIGDARWECTNREECRYIEDLRHYCDCGIYKVPDEEKKDVSLMKPRPTSASNTSAIAKTYISVGGDPEFNLSKLRIRNNQDILENKETGWKLDKLPERERTMIKEAYKIKDAYTVSDVRTTTVVYGYVSNVTVPGFDEKKRLKKYFKQQGQIKYKAYIVKTTGNGLVIELDKKYIVEIIKKENPEVEGKSYEEIVEEAIATINLGEFQEIIDNPRIHGLSIVSCLHAIEHAFLDTATQQIGLDVLGSKILLKDCALIIFEREEVGEGGVYQLTLEDQFMRFMNNVRRKFDCLHDCDEVCLSCLYINDFYCQPYLPTEINRWLPPNSILNRHLGRKGLGD